MVVVEQIQDFPRVQVHEESNLFYVVGERH